MIKTLKYLAIFISIIVGLIVAYTTGPLSSYGSIIAIDATYSQSLQYHYYYSGLLAAIFACITAYLFKANLKITSVVFLVSGILWVTFTQLGDPDFLQYLADAIFEFMAPYIIMGLVIASFTFGINKKWPRLN